MSFVVIKDHFPKNTIRILCEACFFAADSTNSMSITCASRHEAQTMKNYLIDTRGNGKAGTDCTHMANEERQRNKS